MQCVRFFGKRKVHDFICWNSGDGDWAIRCGDWKLVGIKEKTEMFNLKKLKN